MRDYDLRPGGSMSKLVQLLDLLSDAADADRTTVQKVISPGEGESTDDFISRCMSAESGAFPDRDQRFAVCAGKAKKAGRVVNAEHYERACCDPCAGELNPEQGNAFVRTEPNVRKGTWDPTKDMSSGAKKKKARTSKTTGSDMAEEPEDDDNEEGQRRRRRRRGVARNSEPSQEQRKVEIKKQDDELQIVWGEVYVPGIPDAHGHVMRVDEVRKMAYRMMADAFRSTGAFHGSDVQHDNVAQDCVVVESFMAREGDPTFIPDSWVVGLHVEDVDLWHRIKKGELNGFSIQASVYMQKTEIEVDIPDVVTGETLAASDGDLHTHPYRVRFAEDGTFLGGEAMLADGHTHDIRTGSITEPGGGTRHTHRYNLLDVLFGDGVG